MSTTASILTEVVLGVGLFTAIILTLVLIILFARSKLVASGRDDIEVAETIGADWLVYQDLSDLIDAVKYDNGDITEFDTSCFSGTYVTGDVTPQYLARMESERSDTEKHRRELQRLAVEGRYS